MKHFRLSFGFILFLASVALIRPLFSVLGVYDRVDGAWPEAAVTVLIMAVWIGLVVGRRTLNPIGTLALVGVTYGLLSLVPRVAIGVFMPGQDLAPLHVTVLFGILVTNAIWGLLSGLIAKALLWAGR